MSDSLEQAAAPPSWIQKGSCHHPLLESEAEYLVNNIVEWKEIFKAILLFIISSLTIISNVGAIFSINIVQYKR